jgi:uncharacterized membrane protein (DUF4010 family)
MPPSEGLIPTFIDASLAIGIGLLIGLEREHRDITRHTGAEGEASPRAETTLGVRTFALVALFGWLSAYLGETYRWLPIAALTVAGALVMMAAIRDQQAGHGLTTEVAALITLLLGMLVRQERVIAVALGLSTTLLLISKPWFRMVVPRMRRVDLTATLQLLILLAIILPLLPEEARDPWHVLSPRRIGIFVALIAGVGYVGYVLHRLLGGRRGAGLAGLVGGLVSSTAVTAAMAQEARGARGMVQPAQLATLLANAVMLIRVLVIAALVSPSVMKALAGPFAAMVLVTAAGALWKWQRLRQSDQQSATREIEFVNPFSLVPALKWGALFAIVLVASAMARAAFGNMGLVATAGLSGLVDVDAITLAATRLASHGELDVDVAVLAVTVAVASNTLVKGGIAWIGGGRRFGADVAKVFGAAMVIGIGVALARFLGR